MTNTPRNTPPTTPTNTVSMPFGYIHSHSLSSRRARVPRSTPFGQTDIKRPIFPKQFVGSEQSSGLFFRYNYKHCKLDIDLIVSSRRIPHYMGGNIYVGTIYDLKPFLSRLDQSCVILNASAIHTPDPHSPSSRGLPYNFVQCCDDYKSCQVDDDEDRVYLHQISHSNSEGKRLEHDLYSVLVQDGENKNISLLSNILIDVIYQAAIICKKDVVICCAEGVSRSASILSSFLAKFSNLQTCEQSLAFMRQYRPKINPHDFFKGKLEYLYNIERLLKRKNKPIKFSNFNFSINEGDLELLDAEDDSHERFYALSLAQADSESTVETQNADKRPVCK